MFKNNLFIYTCMLSICTLTCAQKGKNPQVMTGHTDENNLYLFVGTYTSEDGSKGIYVYRFNVETGESEYVSEAPIPNPMYMMVSPDTRFVYAVVSEKDVEDAAASAFSFDKQTGQLALLNTELTQAARPCYINMDPAGKFILTANFSGSSVSVFPLADGGTLKPASQVIRYEGTGPDKAHQDKPYLHCVLFSPDGRYLFAGDLGTDRIYKYEVNSKEPFLTASSPEFFQLEPGSGPRHIIFHPNGRYVYAIEELSGKVTAFHYSNGNLEAIQYIAADTTISTRSKASADIHITPDGKFLYASNRITTDGIAIFSINEADGTLTAIGYQPTDKHPQNFVISPNGKYLLVASISGNNVHVFEINPQTGLLIDTGKKISDISKPVCLKFMYP